MRQTLLLFLVLYLPGLPAQDAGRLDSLHRELAARPARDSLYFVILSHLWHATHTNDTERSEQYARRILREGQATGVPEYIALGHRTLGISHSYRGRHDSALYHYARGIDFYRGLGNGFQEGVLVFNTAIIHSDAGRYDSAAYYLERADTLFAAPRYLRQRSAVNHLRSSTERDRGKPARALELATTAYELAREAGDSLRMADAELEIAFGYQDMGEDAAAAERFAWLYRFFRRHNDDYYAAVALVNLATSYQGTEQYARALRYGELADSIITARGYTELEANLRNTLGNLYWSRNEYARAEAEFLRGKELTAGPHSRPSHAEFLTYLAGVQRYLGGKLAAAARHGRRGATLADSLGLPETAHRAYGHLASIAEQGGNFRAAYDYLSRRQALQDTLYRGELADRVAELTLEFERDRRERLIAEQQHQLALLESRARTDRLRSQFLWVGLVGTLLLLAAVAYSLRQRTARQRLERERLAGRITDQERELSTHALQMAQKGQLLEQLSNELGQIRGERPDDRRRLGGLLRELNGEQRTNEDWDNFRAYFQGVHGDFEDHLRARATSKLSARELRLAALIRMQLNNQEIGAILGISQDSLYKAKYRLRKKLPEAGGGELDAYLQRL